MTLQQEIEFKKMQNELMALQKQVETLLPLKRRVRELSDAVQGLEGRISRLEASAALEVERRAGHDW